MPAFPTTTTAGYRNLNCARPRLNVTQRMKMIGRKRMAGRLKGKAALVMGAGSIGSGWGNGKAAAVLFAREGARVICADINSIAAEETAEIIRSEGGEAYAVQ